MANASDSGEILLVEDSPGDAELTIRALQGHGLANDLVWVKDGAEALDFLFATGAYTARDAACPPKVVLLDLRLPCVSGIEVLRRLRSDERTRLTPVVVLTSSSEDVDVKECYRLGVNSYVTKPVSFDDFFKAVSEVGLYWLLTNRGPQV